MDKCEIVSIEIDDKQIMVDKECAEIVLFFNKIGLKTSMCCQGHGKPIFRVWFDVEDSIMEDFVRKTGAWTDVFVRPTNKERTEFETYRGQRGLEGWIYKRHWVTRRPSFPEGIYETVWIYQVEGRTNEDAIRRAGKDLTSMKAMYFGTNLDRIQEAQQYIADARLEKLVQCNGDVQAF